MLSIGYSSQDWDCNLGKPIGIGWRLVVTRHNYEFDCYWLAHQFGLPLLMAYCVIDYNRLRLAELEFTPLLEVNDLLLVG